MKLIGNPRVSPPQKILVIQLRRIGDIILCTPAVRALAKRFPGAQIDFAVEHIGREAILGNPHIENLWILPESGEKGWWDSVRKLRRERYDWVIDFMSGPRSSQFAFLSGAKVRIGLDRFGRRWPFTHRLVEEDSDQNTYAAAMRLRMLAEFGIPGDELDLEIFSDQVLTEESARAKKLIDISAAPLVSFAVGSGNAAKRYPTELSAEVIAELRRKNVNVILTAGPHEREFANEILSRLDSTIPVLENAGVAALAALDRNCHLYIGPDSAPKHVAVACGIPTVTLFGPGNPANWNPVSEKNIVLAAPCEFRPDCDEKSCAERQDLKNISPQTIVDAAMTLLS